MKIICFIEARCTSSRLPGKVLRPSEANTAAERDLFTRIVSAGPDGIVQTPPNVLNPPVDQRGDDVVLFLSRPDIAP